MSSIARRPVADQDEPYYAKGLPYYAIGHLKVTVAADCPSVTIHYQLTDGRFTSPVYSRTVEPGTTFQANGRDEKGEPVIWDDINGTDGGYRDAPGTEAPSCPGNCCRGTGCRWRCGTKYSVWTDDNRFGPLRGYASTLDVVLAKDAQGQCRFTVTGVDQTGCEECGRIIPSPPCPGTETKKPPVPEERKRLGAPAVGCRTCPPRPKPAPSPRPPTTGSWSTGTWVGIIIGATLFALIVILLLVGLLRR